MEKMSSMRTYILRAAGILILSFLVCPRELPAQEKIEKEVRVVKAYEPTLSGAAKIKVFPEADDTLTLRPDFEYSIYPRPLQYRRGVRPIQAARMESDLLPELYGSYLRLGFGSYTTPVGELSISSRRNRNGVLSLYINHMSSQGKVKLDNEQKVFAGYSDTRIDVNAKRIFRNASWKGHAGFDALTRYFYGHRPDTLAEPEKDDIRQRYLLFDAGTEILSTHGDSSRLNYKLGVDYGYTQDLYSNQQHAFRFAGSGFTSFVKGIAGLDLQVDHYRRVPEAAFGNNTLVSVFPWWIKNTPEYRLQLGLNVTVDHGNSHWWHFYPTAMLQFRVIERILVPYLGVRGYVEANDLRKVAMENPFIMPGLTVKNSDHNMEFYGGIKGNMGSHVAFTLRASYALVSDAYFFVNDTITELSNQFDVVYDDLEEVDYYGELLFRVADRWDVLLKGNYYQHTTAVEEKAWHRYQYDGTLSVKYNIRDKILLSADLLAYGPRWARSWDPVADPIHLKGYLDMNLGIEYRYTKILSGFVTLNNLAAARYKAWNQYPMQRFFMLFGFSYSL